MIAKSKKCKLEGIATVPGSKSHTIRAILLATMCKGQSTVRNPLPSLDCQSAMGVARMFGAKTTQCAGVWTVEGLGRDLRVPDNYIDCGNSGTVAYFAAPMAALLDGYSLITGDEQIRNRPIKDLLNVINDLGGQAHNTRKDSLACPAIVHGVMAGGEVNFDGKLSQLVSGIMLVAPLLENKTTINIADPKEKPYLQLTIDWMKRFGIQVDNACDFKKFEIEGNQNYSPCDITIPSDWSGIAFPLLAGIVTDSEIVIDSVDFNDSQGDKAVVDILIEMGADIVKDVEGNRLIVKGGKPLKSDLTIDLSDIPDSLPALSVAAAYANGETTFVGLEHVRLKESDRVSVMEEELTKMGADIESGSDYMKVRGGKTLTGTEIESHHDHRIAMAMIICGFYAEGITRVNDAECAQVSFPNFYEVMEGLNASIERN